jgi:Holliday junction resolvase
MVNSKQKGKRGELELAHWLTDRGYPARRGQQFKGGEDSPDVVCESLGFLNIECKRTERLKIYDAMKQSIADAGEDQTPIVFHRKNGEEWLTILRAEDLIKLLKG